MVSQALTIPLNITWQRFGYSRDMIDKKFGDLSLPPKWRSSLAVFAYVVPREQTAESYPNARIVYLKLSCSITGWNISEELLDPEKFKDTEDKLDDLQNSAWEAIKAQNWARRYWPCKGAIAQIAIYPHPDDNVGPDDFPFIVDFQPQKRELYETRSETGEFLSGSSEKIAVQKGTTATDSTEKSDILTGFGGSAGAQVGPIGGNASFNVSGEWGTRSKQDTQTVDMRTTDASRERRETTSFNTTFSQMYQLFNGYHLGTNRAVFLIAPRPHTVSSGPQVDFNLIKGKRLLEGIQDMFLIVQVPDSLKGICVQALLDTGHTVTGNNDKEPLVQAAHIPDDQGSADIDEENPDEDGLIPIPDKVTDTTPSTHYSQLGVTRRIIRNCGVFDDSHNLIPTGAGDFPDEAETQISFEDFVRQGPQEYQLAKQAKNPVEAQRLIADQRNRLQHRILSSMLSGFSSGRYKIRALAETEIFAVMTGLTMKRVQREANMLVQLNVLTSDELAYFKKFKVQTVGDFFDERFKKKSTIDLERLRVARKKIVEHVLKPARKKK